MDSGYPLRDQHDARGQRERAEPYREMCEFSPTPIALVDEHLLIVRANIAFVTLCGSSREEIEGIMHLTDCIAPDDQRRIGALTGGKKNATITPVSAEVSFINRAGSTVPVSFNLNQVTGTPRIVVSVIDLSSQRQKERDLEKETMVLGAIAESIPYGLVVLDQNFRYIHWNRGMEHLTMIPRSDVVGHDKHPWDVCPDLIEQGVDDLMYRAMRGETSHGSDLEYQRPDGRKGYIAWVFAPLTAGEGNILGIIGLCRDTTTIKSILDSLREKELIFRALTRQSIEGLLLADEQGVVSEWNRGMHEITGLPKDAIIGRPFWEIEDIIHQDPPSSRITQDEVQRRQREFFASGQPPWHDEVCECEILRPDGERRIIEKMIFGIRTEGGYKLGSTVRDITEQKKMKEELEKRNRQLSILHHVISTASGRLDLEDMLDVTLRKVLHLLGYDGGGVYLIDPTAGEAKPCCLYGMPEECREAPGAIVIDDPLYRGVYRDGIPVYEEMHDERFPGREEDGSPSFARIPLMAGSEVVGALHIFNSTPVVPPEDRDILEMIGRELGTLIHRGRLQRELKEAYEKANLYLDIMSHDIANAHTASLGWVEILQEMVQGSEQEYTRKLSMSIRQGIDILNKVSTIRKLHEEEAFIRPVSLDAVIEAEIRHYPDAQISWEPTGTWVYADSLLGEIITNLIGNSLKFGGKEVLVKIVVRESSGQAEVRIEDTGPGIADEVKPAIFKRFQRGSLQVSGKGLGLYICSMLVDRYGGDIWIEDRIKGHHDEGAAFAFTLGLCPAGERPREGTEP